MKVKILLYPKLSCMIVKKKQVKIKAKIVHCFLL
jgi:hypothetical protein